jgi:hypothetical protein
MFFFEPITVKHFHIEQGDLGGYHSDLHLGDAQFDCQQEH